MQDTLTQQHIQGDPCIITKNTNSHNNTHNTAGVVVFAQQHCERELLITNGDFLRLD